MPVIGVGGVEKNFVIISNYLSKKFKKVTIITTSSSQKKKFNDKINFVSYKKINIENFSRRIKFFFGLFLLFLEILKNKNNLILCFQANIYCVYLCKILRTKIIVRSNSAPTGWSQSFIKKIFYKNALSIADKIIVNSLEFKKLLKKKFNVNAICIYNPLNKFEVLAQSKKKISSTQFKKSSLNFINVARFVDQKDHVTLINAFVKLKNKINFNLLLVGEGEKEEEIRNLIKNNNLKRYIKIKKFIKNPFPYIKKSDAFILSSKYEGLPNVLLESIILNKLIISSNCPTGPKEILDNGKGGLLFKTGDSIDLAKKILFFINNKKECDQKIKYSKKRILRFDFKNNLIKYHQLINNF